MGNVFWYNCIANQDDVIQYVNIKCRINIKKVE